MTEAGTWASIAEQLPLLASLPKPLRPHVEIRLVKQGTSLFRRGDRPRSMIAVLAGEVRLVRTAHTGAEIVLQRTRRGFFAEGSLDQPRYHCDGIATAATRFAAIPRAVFKKALADEDFRTAWTGELLHELRRVRTQAERLSLRSAEDRIIHFIESEGDEGKLTLTQSRKDWASELGLTHEALYRTLSRMETAQVLRSDGLKLELLR